MRTSRLFVLSVVASCLATAAEPVLRLDLGAGTTLDLVLVRSGAFTQGSPADEPGRGTDETQRPVRIGGDYYIGRTAVTRGQWERFVSETGYRSEAEVGNSGGFGWDGKALTQQKSFTWRNPGFAQTAAHPVCLVTFPDAQAFCAWLERKSQRKVTLPTEAQWEYACRAGTTTPWHAGATTADGDKCAWHKGNAGNGTRPADSTTPNSWGLFIGGNVAEWCLDWYAPYPAGEAVDPRQDNPNLSDKARRVLRGGSWVRDAKNTRSAARYRVDPRSRNADTGLRIVCATEITAPPPPKPPPAPPAPKVEADIGAAPPPVPPPASEPPMSPPETPRSTRFSISGMLGSLVCLAVPLALVVLLVRLVARSQTPAKNPFVAQPPRPVRPVVPDMLAPVRVIDDGFWINGNWPAGTALKLRYLLGGAVTTQDLVYRPGADGQFIYTGTRPDSVSVVTDGVDDLLQPAALFTEPTVFADHHQEIHSDSPPPPISPSAY